MPWNLMPKNERKPQAPRMRPSRINPPKPKQPARPPKPPSLEGYAWRWQK